MIQYTLSSWQFLRAKWTTIAWKTAPTEQQPSLQALRSKLHQIWRVLVGHAKWFRLGIPVTHFERLSLSCTPLVFCLIRYLEIRVVPRIKEDKLGGSPFVSAGSHKWALYLCSIHSVLLHQAQERNGPPLRVLSSSVDWHTPHNPDVLASKHSKAQAPSDKLRNHADRS